MARRNVIIRALAALWSGADAVRKALHLLLLLFLFVVFLGLVSGSAPPRLPDSAALVIRPNGSLVEQLEGDAYDRAVEQLLDKGRPQTLVQDVVDALRYAKDDEHIEAVYLDLGGLFGGGLSKLQRIGAAIDDFRRSGKPVIANADFLSQPGYYLAAHADTVYLHPDGAVWLPGYGAYTNYFKDAIDLLRIDWNVFRVGTHKSFVEPYTRMGMSDEDRDMRERLIGRLWEQYKTDVTAARGLDGDTLQRYADEFLASTQDAAGDLATVAVNFGLVDELLNGPEVRDQLIDRVGDDPDRPDTFSSTGMSEYLAVKRMLTGGTAGEDNVAVIVAAGEILFGSQPPGTIGSDSTAALLRRAHNDESVRAVVLRVDSPGGSSFASEVIADEIRALQDDGIPVVASMSGVAASGGYLISVDADRIVASPATITGSIGVFGMFPTFQRSLSALGVATDGVGTTPWSGALRADREMSDESRALFQAAIEDTYEDFVGTVAANRGMSRDAVDRVGQGQVWTGAEALELGLVDELGELDDAIALAAGLADLEDFGTKSFDQRLSTTEQLIVDLLGAGARLGVDVSAFARRPSALESLADDITAKAKTALRFNDPKGIYSHCFCEIR